MGNGPTRLEATAVTSSVQDFEHSFEAQLEAASDPRLPPVAGDRPVSLCFDRSTLSLVASVGERVGDMRDVVLTSWQYGRITELGWDHAQSWLRVTGEPSGGEYREAGAQYVVLKVASSLELEEEMRERFGAVAGAVLPRMSYMGVFAGKSKPRPFERRRASLTVDTQDRLPALKVMRDWCQTQRVDLTGCAMRRELAMQHIHEGQNHFAVEDAARTRTLVLDAESVRLFDGAGSAGTPVLEVAWAEVESWSIHEELGLEIKPHAPKRPHLFCVQRHQLGALRHTTEFFWNQVRETQHLSPMRGSTHGRRVQRIHTLTGEQDPPGSPARSCAAAGCNARRLVGRHGYCQQHAEVYAAAGTGARPHGLSHRRSSAWGTLVRHQGPLQRRTGVARRWTTQHAVLYRTSQGHALALYGSVNDLPLATSRFRERAFIDLAAVTTLRPVSADTGAFDIVTVSQTFTLRAESEEDEQHWLTILSRAVDEDVAIAPDEALEFRVKPLSDPTDELPLYEYSTTLSFSMGGLTVCVGNTVVMHMYYTDFYKWSVTRTDGKKALFLSVFKDTTFEQTLHFMFRTREADAITQCIEFYIEKFIALMQVVFPPTPSGVPAGLEPAEEGEGEGEGEEEAKGEFTRVNTGQYVVDAVHRSRNEPPSAEAEAVAAAGAAGGGGDDDSSDDEEDAPAAVDEGDLLHLEPEAPAAGSPARPGPLANVLEPSFVPDSPRNRPARSLSVDRTADGFELMPPLPPMRRSSSIAEELEAPPGVVDETDLRADPAVRANAAALLYREQGMLFDGERLSVSLASEFRGSQARLTFTLASKVPPPLRALEVTLLQAEELRSQISLSSSKAEAGRDAQAQVMLEVMRPFDVAPALRVQYELGGAWYAVVLPVPALAPCFAAPAQLPVEQFLERWRAIGDDPALPQQQVVVAVKQSVGPADLAELAAMLHAAVVPGADPQPSAEGAAAIMQTGAPATGGGTVAVGYLLRLEVAASAFRVTVRATNKIAAVSVAAAARAVVMSRWG